MMQIQSSPLHSACSNCCRVLLLFRQKVSHASVGLRVPLTDVPSPMPITPVIGVRIWQWQCDSATAKKGLGRRRHSQKHTHKMIATTPAVLDSVPVPTYVGHHVLELQCLLATGFRSWFRTTMAIMLLLLLPLRFHVEHLQNGCDLVRRKRYCHLIYAKFRKALTIVCRPGCPYFAKRSRWRRLTTSCPSTVMTTVEG